MDLKCMECQWMNMVSRISSRECDITVLSLNSKPKHLNDCRFF